MRLFHASNIEVKLPKIINRFKTLDFGTDFYTTSNKGQAEGFARKVYLTFIESYRLEVQ